MAGSPERPTVEHYFMDMTHLVKARGTCPRRRVGAVIVKDKRVLTTGYNGAPRNFPHPIDVGCLRDELQIPRGMVADICPCLHAEQNAIIQAATTGVSIEGSEIYCTTQPCTQCSRMIANCGITRVIFEEEYPDPLAVGILTTAGVELWKWDAASQTAHRVEGSNTFEQAQDELRRRWAAGTMNASPPAASAAAPVPKPLAPKPLAPKPLAKPLASKPAPKPGFGTAPPKVPVTSPRGAAPERAELPDVSAAQEAVEPQEEFAKAAGVRDLKDDPNRAALIRKLAHDKAEKRRQARGDKV